MHNNKRIKLVLSITFTESFFSSKLTVIMLLIVAICLILVICTLFLHYGQHFKFQFIHLSDISAARSRSTSVALTTKDIIKNQKLKNKKCCCTIGSTDNQDYDFFPSSFCWYMIFMIFLCIVLIIKCCVLYMHNNKRIKLVLSITDYIIIYGMMIISVWESSFSFCRYFTTKMATTTCRLVSTNYILKRFILYIILYAFLFSICMHVTHGLWPAVVALHCTFNMYCICSNAKRLIERYEIFLTSIKNQHNDIVSAIYFMKKISILSNIISTIYLCIFLYAKNVNLMYYICILWALSCFIFSLNFVRNRKYILYKCYRISQYILCKYILCKSCKNKNSIPICKNKNKNKNKNSIQKTNSFKNKVSIKLETHPTEEDFKASNYNTLPMCTPASAIKTPSVNGQFKFAANNPYKNMIKTRTFTQIHTHTDTINNNNNNKNKSPSNKAFNVLGLTPSCSNKYFCDS
eukprot:522483_1